VNSATYTYGTTGHTNALTSDATTTAGVTKTNTYTYDAAGNTLTRTTAGVTRTSTWNPDGTLASVTQPGKTSSYVYNVEGQQVLRADPAGTTLFLPGMDVTVAAGTTTAKGIRYYEYDGQTIAQRTTAGLRALFADQVGTSHTSVDWSNLSKVTRRFTDPYGNQLGVIEGPWQNGRSFLDRPLDASTGLVDMGARKYDPSLGRFLSVDPVLDPGNPLSLNGYSYTNGDPVNDADPTGEWSWRSAWSSAKNYVGGAARYVVQSSVEIGQFTATVGMWASGRKSWSQASQSASRWANRTMSRYSRVESRMGIDRNSRAYRAGYTTAKVVDTVSSVISPAKGALRLAAKIGVRAVAKAAVKQAARRAISSAAATGARAVRNTTAVTKKAVTSVGQAVRGGAPATKRSAGAAAAKARPASKSVDIGPSAASACSFSGDTVVLMADGTLKPIDQVQPGDKVIATDPETGEQAAKPVETVFVHEDRVVQLVVDGESLTTTEDHPFWSETTQRFERADNLRPGHELLSADGQTLRVDDLVLTAGTTEVLAYNLEVRDIHTYHVGTTTTLVHNSCAQPRNSKGQFTSGAGGDSASASQGRASHDNYATALGGDGDGYVINMALPRSSLRPDAYSESLRVVRELKPDTASGVRRGRRQLARYKQEVERVYGDSGSWTFELDLYNP
jgi:RHS repeat-associated protein